MDLAGSRSAVEAAEADLRAGVARHGWGSPLVSAASERLDRARRDLAAAMGRPFAVPIDIGAVWDTGAPCPELVKGRRTFVAYYTVDNRGFDGTNPKSRGSGHDQGDGVGVVEFIGTIAADIGWPNDEALNQHPLFEWGLEPYTPHIVENSAWLSQVVKANTDTDMSTTIGRLHHYLFTFHDETLNCLATDLRVWSEGGPLPPVVTRLRELAFDQG